ARGGQAMLQEYQTRFPDYAEVVAAVVAEVGGPAEAQPREESLAGDPPDGGRSAVVPDQDHDTEAVGPLDPPTTETAIDGGSARTGTRADPSTQVGSDSASPSGDGTVPSPVIPVVPGYTIEGELGRGGMGVVYRARQVRLDRPCALKMILAGTHAAREAVARFLAEARAIARLQHPHIVQIHHIREADGLPFFELEYLPGGSLDRQLDGTPWQPRRAAGLVEQLADAMAEAHRLGVVHRDLKPANVLLAADGTPKITD